MLAPDIVVGEWLSRWQVFRGNQDAAGILCVR